MFQYEITPFGEFDRYTFYDQDRRNSFSIVPAYGATFVELILNGQSLLDAYADASALKVGERYKNAFLFPFPNRLKNGQYSFEDASYQFPVNEPITNSAVHGFGRDCPFEVVHTFTDTNFAELHCKYEEKGEKSYYPFAFRVDLKVRLAGQSGLSIEMKLGNIGTKKLPAALGWHPYFDFGETVNDLKLQLPACQKIMVDEQMIPTGERVLYENFSQLQAIGETAFDTCFALEPTATNIAEVWVEGAAGRLRYWQQMGLGKFDYLQVFTPPDRNSLALEPMSSNIDAFNNGQGLTVLEPGEVMGGSFGVKWKPVK